MLAPLIDPHLARSLAERGVTAISLDGLPRTLSRAQGMDALTSQANVAGYKAALVAAEAYGRFFPLLITAAGTARPAKLLVLGTGVAGLQAIGTARRLGAQVSGYDVRPASKGEVESLGATFIELTSASARPARAATPASSPPRSAPRSRPSWPRTSPGRTWSSRPRRFPGGARRCWSPPEAVAAMAPGSVIVDMGASPLGGNVAGSVPGEAVVTPNGVTVIGAENLAASVPTAASNAYSRNISALLLQLVSADDEGKPGAEHRHHRRHPGRGGRRARRRGVHPAVAKLLAAESANQGS